MEGDTHTTAGRGCAQETRNEGRQRGVGEKVEHSKRNADEKSGESKDGGPLRDVRRRAKADTRPGSEHSDGQ